jgi:SPP1 gp7 family putative phage head morphogenesis protein
MTLLMGMDHASRKLGMADTEIPPLPFEEAVSFMKGRVPVTKAEWNDILEPKLHFRAFTVARLAQCDFIEAVRGRLINAMQDGEGFASTWKDIKAIADEDGAFQFRPGYWENVFRTNTQTAYTAGKLMQFKNHPPPAWRLLVIDDSRTSDICRGLIRGGKQDITLSSDHPFWRDFGFPPYHYQCRTGLQAVYKSEIEDGAVMDNPSIEEMKERFKPMDGFGENPLDKESWWKITNTMIKRANKYGIWPDILQQTADLDMISYQKELLKGYIHIYDGNNGGYVQQAKNWEYSKKEMDAAKELANEGHQIYLLPRNPSSKSADMLIDNKIGEIKHQEKPGAGSIKSELYEAGRHQRARVVVMYPLKETSFEDIQTGLYKTINKTPVQTVILKWREKSYNLPRKLLMNKDWKLP